MRKKFAPGREADRKTKGRASVTRTDTASPYTDRRVAKPEWRGCQLRTTDGPKNAIASKEKKAWLIQLPALKPACSTHWPRKYGRHVLTPQEVGGGEGVRTAVSGAQRNGPASWRAGAVRQTRPWRRQARAAGGRHGRPGAEVREPISGGRSVREERPGCRSRPPRQEYALADYAKTPQ